MIHNIKRKTLFFVGIFLTGLLGILNSYMRTNYSKSNSLVVPTANADVPSACSSCGCPWTESECAVYYCFPVGTPISTPSGCKEIQDVAIGDVIYGFDIETGERGAYPVVKTFKHNKNDADSVYSPLIKITHEKGVLILTDNHLVYRRNGRIGNLANFDRAGMLQIGDMLTLEDGEEVAITAIEGGPEYDFVYNLEVENVHTYFADGVRVHNSGAGGCCGSSGGFK